MSENTRRETRMLPVKMKEKEKIEAGVELATAETDLAALKLDAKAVATVKRKGIAEQQKLVTRLSTELTAGHRVQEVACEVVEDMNGKRVKRLDTKQVIETGALTPEEFAAYANPPLIDIGNPMGALIVPPQKKGKKGKLCAAPAPGTKSEVDLDLDEDEPPESRDEALN